MAVEHHTHPELLGFEVLDDLGSDLVDLVGFDQFEIAAGCLALDFSGHVQLFGRILETVVDEVVAVLLAEHGDF
eukprot:CAMPEP_0168627640 /NCGR_PEP_ID=MMETSP0449_2-20121227/11372_1 /TAXON_ID=1082188 /ORGANISM="Strombidium rassoulzadegani, Strain ras09" /LENGTH=73 /DNA_ID=CAMNT_0008669913 /DNA_START=134 /DNA_END=352 /DNA_ORIENTATION=+